MIIYLKHWLPNTFSDLPESFGRAILKCSPIWSCSGWGLPCQISHLICGELLPPLFTLTLKKINTQISQGGIFSVALSLGLPPLGVTQHPALWSSDFPLVLDTSDHLIYLEIYCTICKLIRFFIFLPRDKIYPFYFKNIKKFIYFFL